MVTQHFRDWAPGLVIDGVLLLVVNTIFRRHERARVLNQVGSLSREFALDAVRRARDEGWLADGSLRNRAFRRANLQEADLAGADLSGADLEGADLRWSDLRGALLEGARLQGALTSFASVDAPGEDRPVLPGAVPGGFLAGTQVREVQRTFGLLQEQGSAPIELFYRRLFEQAPELRGLFRADPGTQSRKFMHSLKVIVAALGAPERHVALLERLGERHRGYGARPEHYARVGEVLLSVLQDTLGPAFTADSREAWARAYHLMAAVMTGGEAAAGGGSPETRTSREPNRRARRSAALPVAPASGDA